MRLAAAVLALAAGLSLTACSGGHASPSASASDSGVAATRWWGDGAQGVGSTIDPKDPTAAAKNLHPSRQTYCEILKQTVSAGHSILPGASANSPALLASTEAFVAELQGVAPAAVSQAWKLLGATVLSLVETGGKNAAAGDVAQLSTAVTTVANDAKTQCGVSLAG